jgi:hypothetical protein
MNHNWQKPALFATSYQRADEGEVCYDTESGSFGRLSKCAARACSPHWYKSGLDTIFDVRRHNPGADRSRRPGQTLSKNCANSNRRHAPVQDAAYRTLLSPPTRSRHRRNVAPSSKCTSPSDVGLSPKHQRAQACGAHRPPPAGTRHHFQDRLRRRPRSKRLSYTD